MRKQGSCLQKEIMQGTTRGTHRWGRPHTAWIDNIKTWTGLPLEESIRMAEDRDKWRKFIHGVANRRIEGSERTEQNSSVTLKIFKILPLLQCTWLTVTTKSFITDMRVNNWQLAFSALTLVGRQDEQLACKNWVMKCWCGYLSGARYRLFVYGTAAATAIPTPHNLLTHLNPGWFLPFWYTSLPRLSWKRGH